MGRQLGEAERHGELAQEHQRPGPVKRRPARAISHVNIWNTPVRIEMYEKPGRERRKTAERPVEHLLVAERGQVLDVFGLGWRHELIPWPTRGSAEFESCDWLTRHSSRLMLSQARATSSDRSRRL